MKLRVILTGATGMAGEGVLQECLQNENVEAVLVVGRRPCNVTHPKLKEIIHNDFFNVTPIQEQLKGYNACFFCLGVSSVGMKEAEYYQKTYVLTMHFAETVSKMNSDLTFCYISGGGTDSTEKGRSMWARVKGKTENDLQKLPFKKVYNFRAGMMKPSPGAKNVLSYYKYFAWMYPMMRAFGMASTLAELSKSMIYVSTEGFNNNIVKVKDIVALAKKLK